ncbi:MAG: hypothetical protein ABMB14_35045 [Myxococcota bacterium]
MFAAAFTALFALAALGLTAVLSPPTRPAPPLVVDPAPRDPTVQAPPFDGAAKVSTALDRIEAAEAEKFGAAEAARRRRQREQMIDERVKHRAKPEP